MNWFLLKQEHCRLPDAVEAREEAVRIQCLEDWNRYREVDADEGCLALVREPLIHILNYTPNYILTERPFVGCVYSWGGQWDWVMVPESESQPPEWQMDLGKSLWRRLDKVCGRFWSFEAWCSHSSSVTDSPYSKTALGLKPDSLGENCHPGSGQNWMGRALPLVCRGAGDPSTMIRRPH